MSRLLLTISFLMCASFMFAQSTFFDKYYKKTELNSLNNSPIDINLSTDTHYSLAQNDIERAEAILLKAHILKSYGLSHRSIKLLEQADSIVKPHNFPVIETKIYGLLATTYRKKKFTKQASYI